MIPSLRLKHVRRLYGFLPLVAPASSDGELFKVYFEVRSDRLLRWETTRCMYLLTKSSIMFELIFASTHASQAFKCLSVCPSSLGIIHTAVPSNSSVT